jgi:hypothetical protein
MTYVQWMCVHVMLAIPWWLGMVAADGEHVLLVVRPSCSFS